MIPGEDFLSFNDLVARSKALLYAFPTRANRIAELRDRGPEIEAQARAVRPILCARLLPLLDGFLAFKRAHGSPTEQALYAGLDRVGLIHRLLTCRPLSFLTAADIYLLRDRLRGQGGFEAIGTPAETPPLCLARLQSYDEMSLSALLGVSVPTLFINSGSRGNAARPGRPGSFEPSGVYVGLVGARFEQPGFMEWAQMMVDPHQNTPENGYGTRASPQNPFTLKNRLFTDLYGISAFPEYREASSDRTGRFVPLSEGCYLDTLVYKRRLALSIEPFLQDADDRARAAGRPAYVHVVGLGLGVWGVHPCQTRLMVEVYAELLGRLRLPHLSDLDFSWFSDAETCGGIGDGEVFVGNGCRVRLHFSRRDPAAALTGDDRGKLLVAMYAWDANAFPGNEYWMGSLTASGDPAAACCSTIPELQNPDINPAVSGANARIFDENSPEPQRLTDA